MLLLLYQRISSYQEETSDNISLPGVIKKCYMSLDKLQLVFLSFFFFNARDSYETYFGLDLSSYAVCFKYSDDFFFFLHVNNLVKVCE